MNNNIMKKNMTLFALIISFLVLSCTNKQERLRDFYKTLKYEIQDSAMLDKIKLTSDDSLYKLIPAFTIIYKQAVPDSLRNDSIWSAISGENFASLTQTMKNEIIIRSFKKYLNEAKIDFNEIKEDVLVFFENLKKENLEQDVKFENELREIIKYNQANYNQNDTLLVSLPLERIDNRLSIYYKKYPNSLSYKNADDSLSIKGILLSKFFNKESTGHITLNNEDLFNLFFKIKVIDINTKTSRDGAIPLQIGDTFNLHLESYGRQIK